MKLSKLFHVLEVIVGLAGIVTLIAAITAGSTGLVWGLTREHLLLCGAILMLIAIWGQIGAIHHLMLEKKGEWL